MYVSIYVTPMAACGWLYGDSNGTILSSRTLAGLFYLLSLLFAS